MLYLPNCSKLTLCNTALVNKKDELMNGKVTLIAGLDKCLIN